ncbi:hypothetical protein [Natrarchaeobius oligotrophus]|uniref:hypothetical protein n=1 Tax=Natrarchaeobius oligotrophus TaxID=3455743 RepID=UPI000F52C123|nr:hypothetical protein [Natrarchaeobius chitinivorans]
MTELESLDGVAGNIFGSYVHNGGSGSISSISGGSGPIGVEYSLTDGEIFDLTDDGNPDPYM